MAILLRPALLVFLFLLHLFHNSEGIVVTTDKGQIRGYSQTVLSNSTVQTFLGIPFAAPPVGDLRFKPPAQLDPWEDILSTTKLPNSCIQPLDPTFGNFTGSTMWNANTKLSEDCLYLNVWVPDTPTEKKAVIVWIYGGGFSSGSATLDIYDGRYLAAETDVIVVSMQYRVGSLGFLSLDTPEAPGNAGLWDQRMALEWVNRNIHQFGGDPQSVTLMGESAGAASVGLFLICDLCRGYFHKAIIQSGSPTATWSVLPKEEIWKRSNILAETNGCNPKAMSAEELVFCLRQVDAATLLSHDYSGTTHGFAQFPFVPIVDGIFITQDPKDMIQKGNFKKSPLLIGSNENEGTFFEIYSDTSIYNRETESPITPENYKKLINQFMFKHYPVYPDELTDLGLDTIAFQYRNWLNPESGVENRISIDRAVSDAYFVCPVNELALAFAHEDAPVYYYWFNQRWSANPWPKWMGVLHGDEIWFTFGHPLDEQHSFTEGERELSRRMMTYWANFAKTGSPNTSPDVDWPLFTEKDRKYRILSVDAISGGPTTGQNPRTEQCAFWDNFFPKVIEESCKLNDAESSWQGQFQSWKKRYIEGWNDQFDTFLDNFKNNGKKCTGEP